LQGNARENIIARLQTLQRLQGQLMAVTSQLEQLVDLMPPDENVDRKGKEPLQ
jgi:hypothetical protein